MSKKRVVIAMSGGVDSSVAAALLVEQGFDVVGVTMQLWPEADPLEEARQGGCCSLAAVEDARRVADILGIPYYVLNLREDFEARVVEYFVAEYIHGRTPNPCIACNRWVKFDVLLQRTRELDADYLATGHYARIRRDDDRGRYLLYRPADREKDQTYVLYGMTQEQLAGTLFPLGDLRKEEVRRMAAALGLPVADKPDSQEICFVPAGGHGEFVAARAGGRVRPGPILDTEGRELGVHRGLSYYTIGQRRGLGISAERPLYVVALDESKNAVIVGEDEEASARGARVGDVNLISLDWSDLAEGSGIEAQVQIRYRSRSQPARLEPSDASPGCLRVTFAEAQRALTPGQAAVFYDGDMVIGGGTIEMIYG